MAHPCPLMNLPRADEDGSVSEAVGYSKLGATLDFFKYFLFPGNHVPTPMDEIDNNAAGNCEWTLTEEQDGSSTYKLPWSLTRADCAISLSDSLDNGRTAMAEAITNFHIMAKEDTTYLLLCAFRMLATHAAGDEGGACDSLAEDTVGHLFGASF